MFRRLTWLPIAAALSLGALAPDAALAMSAQAAQNPANGNKLPCTITTSNTTCGPYTPILPDFHIAHAPSGFTASCQIERKVDGTNWSIVTVTSGGSSTQMENWSFASSSQATSEDLEEHQAGVPYQFRCTSVSAGSDLVTFIQ